MDISVHTLAGRCLEFHCEPHGTVHDVKVKVMAAWQVRPSHQKVVHETVELMDSLPLGLVVAHAPGCCTTPLSLLVVTTEQPIESTRLSRLAELIDLIESSDGPTRR